MYNTDEVILNAKKYLKKLQSTINTRASFSFGSIKIVNKSAIDDVLCCLEAILPQEYRTYSQRYGTSGMKSYMYLQKIHAAIKNKFFLSTDVYSVKHVELEPLITAFSKELRHDLEKIAEANI